jgi:hypothetical protein
MPAILAKLRLVLPLLLPIGLAACSGGGGRARLAVTPSYERTYIAPGPPEDPWGPYIHEASARFTVPQGWIRAIIRQESGGHQYLHGRPVTSDAGAMGLMQLMPATYAELRDRYNLGNDPYEPHDNIMAGTGYISELYARYGAPAFLVAYDAGPRRMDEYNAGRGTLPNETVAYLASVAPALAAEGKMTGPLAAYAYGEGQLGRDPVQVYASYARPLGGCWRDPNAAYDPDDTCNRATAPASAPIRSALVAGPTAVGSVLWGANGNPAPAAPPRPAAPVPMNNAPMRIAALPEPPPPAAALPPSSAAAVARQSYPAPVHIAMAPRHSHFTLINAAQAEPVVINAADARWGVQVGAFIDPGLARATAERARRVAPQELARARTALGKTTPFGGHVLYRARLEGITHPAAQAACGRLTAARWDCLTVPPGA